MDAAVRETIEAVASRRPAVVVIGDFLLDGWWSGQTHRIAREAPAPVVDLTSRSYAPGGAANTAANLASLGAHVHAVGVVGADEAGRTLRELLADAGVDVTRLRPEPGARTTTKVRVSVDEQLLMRLDEAGGESALPARRARFLDDVRETTAHADAQLVCDYGSALLDEATVAAIGEGPRPPIRVVDAHQPEKWAAAQPDLVTPNAEETERITGVRLGAGEERVEGAAAVGGLLRQRTGARSVIVTLDRSGTVLLRPGRHPRRTWARPAPERNASGAGDVFVAAITAALGSGLSLERATDFAQAAADVAVTRSGTCTCSLDELLAAEGTVRENPHPVDELAEQLEGHRRRGERIVFTNGCFDVLHRGHTSYLRQAKSLGDVLVVALNSDASVRRLKGPERPVNGEADRAGIIAELASVDYVTVFDEDTPVSLIRRLRPDVYAKGGDYLPDMLPETPEVRGYGGEVVILGYLPNRSTTEMIGRIRGPGPRTAAAVEADER